MQLHNPLEHRDNAAVLLVIVRLAHSDMIDSEPHERLGPRFVVALAANVHCSVGHVDGVGDDVEGRQANASVKGNDVAGEGLFGGVISEG